MNRYTPYTLNTPHTLPSRWGDDSDDDTSPSPRNGDSSGPAHLGVSIFDYISREAARTPHFHNTLYCTELQQPVLRPFSHMSDLVLWDYYVREELRFGPPYDLEIAGLETAQEEELETTNGEVVVAKQSLTFGYDNLTVEHPESTAALLGEVCRLEMELGHLPRDWGHHWGGLEAPPAHPPPPPPQGGGSSHTPALVTTPR